jgi:hypothetical protein
MEAERTILMVLEKELSSLSSEREDLIRAQATSGEHHFDTISFQRGLRLETHRSEVVNRQVTKVQTVSCAAETESLGVQTFTGPVEPPPQNIIHQAQLLLSKMLMHVKCSLPS